MGIGRKKGEEGRFISVRKRGRRENCDVLTAEPQQVQSNCRSGKLPHGKCWGSVYRRHWDELSSISSLQAA